MDDAEAWRLGFFDPAEAPECRLMRSNEERFREFQNEHRDRLGNHFYVIVVPKTLDMLEVCLAFLPDTVPVFLVLNGLEPWEQAFVETQYPDIPKFTLETRRGSILFDRVLDMFVECNDSNFGILDQDCFVLNRRYFSRLQLGKDYFAVSPFVTHNAAANITFPRTYFLFLNLAEIRRLRDKYRISFKRCWTLPANVEEPLKSLGLGHDNYPHESLGYFDTFQLIWAMALYEGLTYGRGPSARRFLGWQGRNMVHVGAGSDYLTDTFRDSMTSQLAHYDGLPQLEKQKFNAAVFAYYAHLLLLENSGFYELKERYMPFFVPFGTSQEFLNTFRSRVSAGRVKEMDLTIQRLRRARHGR
jgi:hypothetical protein